MATVRWYLRNGVNADGWQELSPTAQTAATCTAGWVVGTGATFSSELQSNTERASTTFVANTVPDGTLDLSLKDAFSSPMLEGTFDAGNWTFQFTVQGVTQSGAADGQIVFRVLKANPDGSGATEITSAQQTASVVTNVTSTDLSSSLTIALPAISLLDQCIFVQVAWKRTGAGGMTTTNVRLRAGVSATVGTSILTSNATLVIKSNGTFNRTTANCTITAAGTAAQAGLQLTNVQTTGKVVAPNSNTLNLTFPSAPTLGNGLVVFVGAYSYTGGQGVAQNQDQWFQGCTDNYGNKWVEVTTQCQSTWDGLGVFYLPKVEATGPGFTVTVRNNGYIYTPQVMGSAHEIGNVQAWGADHVLTLPGLQHWQTNMTAIATAQAYPVALTGELMGFAFVYGSTNAAVTFTQTQSGWTNLWQEPFATNEAATLDRRHLFGPDTGSCAWSAAAGSNCGVLLALFKAGPPPAIHKVAASQRWAVAGPVASAAITVAVPPRLGHGLVVTVYGHSSGGPMVFGGCSDNYGNAYTLAEQRQITVNTNYAVATYYCPKVVATGAPFTVTVSGTTGNHTFELQVHELGGAKMTPAFPGMVLYGVTGQAGAADWIITSPYIFLSAGTRVLIGAFVTDLSMMQVNRASLEPPWRWDGFHGISNKSGPPGGVGGGTMTRPWVKGVGLEESQNAQWGGTGSPNWATVYTNFEAFTPPARSAVLTQTLQPATCEATAASVLAVNAALTQTLPNTTLSATGAPGLYARIGALTQTTGNATCLAAATVGLATPTMYVKSAQSQAWSGVTLPVTLALNPIPIVGEAILIAINDYRTLPAGNALLSGVTDNYGNTITLVVSANTEGQNAAHGASFWLCRNVVVSGPGLTLTIVPTPGWENNHYLDVTVMVLAGLTGPLEVLPPFPVEDDGFGTVVSPGTPEAMSQQEFLLFGIMQAGYNQAWIAPSGGWTVRRYTLGPVPNPVGQVVSLGGYVVGTAPETVPVSWTIPTSSYWAAAELFVYCYRSGPRNAASANTLPNCTCSATGTITAPVIRTGTLTQTLANATCSAAGVVVWPTRTAVVTQTLSASTVVSASTVFSTALLTRTLDSATLAATAVGISGQPIAMII